ncbi:hypothetical protein [Agrobacterium pusense]|uniref:hypothetical protein n=1 Tax=Agrobacterium pusense TaxID=648995 RepID=UPI000D37B3A5|nr:hypothetical protein [Agrobacterium pusense]PTV70182.1 hypothetical protein DBL06_25295 [Agrobacterium pusense]
MVTSGMAAKWQREAKQNAGLKPIIDEVERTYKVTLELTADPTWSSMPNKKRAVIEVSDTNRPLPSFAHEYLHLRLSARGYKHILGSINFDVAKNDRISNLLSALDNELQHHRMFDDFVAAGFDPGDFYAESDDMSHVGLRSEIEKLSFMTQEIDVLLTFLSLIAPGGRWPDGEREAMRDLLKTNIPAGTWSKLVKIEALIATWKQQADLNPLDTIASILETIGGCDDTFIGIDASAYPNHGTVIPRMNMNPAFDKAVRDYMAKHGKK